MFKSNDVDTNRCPGKTVLARDQIEALPERVLGRKIQRTVAPLQHFQGVEVMTFNLFDQVVVQRIDPPGNAKGAVLGVAPGTSGYLSHFRRCQLPVLIAVIFPVAGKGDVVDVEVEAHADGIGRHQVIDIAVLKQFHLRISGARAERAEDDRRAAALAPDEFGNRIDFV